MPGWLLPVCRSSRDRTDWSRGEPLMVDQERWTPAPAGPAMVTSCWLCGIRSSPGQMVADGGSACADVRWYCLDTRGCTQRWTSHQTGAAGPGHDITAPARAPGEHLTSRDVAWLATARHHPRPPHTPPGPAGADAARGRCRISGRGAHRSEAPFPLEPGDDRGLILRAERPPARGAAARACSHPTAARAGTTAAAATSPGHRQPGHRQPAGHQDRHPRQRRASAIAPAHHPGLHTEILAVLPLT